MQELKLYSDQRAIVLNPRQARILLEIIGRAYTHYRPLCQEERGLADEIVRGLEEDFAEPPGPEVMGSWPSAKTPVAAELQAK